MFFQKINSLFIEKFSDKFADRIIELMQSQDRYLFFIITHELHQFFEWPANNSSVAAR